MNQFINFFFPSISSKKILFFRVSIGIAILLHISSWIWNIDRLFLSVGYLPAHKLQYFTAPSNIHFLEFFSDFYILVFYLILFLSNIFFIIGIFPRASLILIYLIFSAFINRFPPMYYGGYQFLIFSIFIFLFQPNYGPPIISKFNRFTNISKAFIDNSFSIRAVQIQVCYIYLVSALMKIHEPTWFNGTQMAEVLNIYGAYWNFSWLFKYPSLVALMTYGPMFSELAFPFLIWFKQTRAILIAVLIVMHSFIILTMNVTWLSETMICLLMVFVEPEEDFKFIKKHLSLKNFTLLTTTHLFK